MSPRPPAVRQACRSLSKTLQTQKFYKEPSYSDPIQVWKAGPSSTFCCPSDSWAVAIVFVVLSPWPCLCCR